MNLKTTLSKIKNLKIQGAENIAIASARTIQHLAGKQNYQQLLKAKEQLIKARPTEPCTYNTMQYAFLGTKDPEQISENANNAIKHLTQSKETIAELCSKKIRTGNTVFTHCHSSTVIESLKKAKAQGKRFKVFNTETRPLYQGRITAAELIKAGIDTTLFIDSAARIAIKKADMVLFGCDAITAEGKVINKIGSELFAETAKKHSADVYICTDSWKFDPKSIFHETKIEQRSKNEVWPNAPKKLKISNYAFECIDSDLITAIISEKGVLTPESFISHMTKENKQIP